jgi:hypothetical protein
MGPTAGILLQLGSTLITAAQVQPFISKSWGVWKGGHVPCVLAGRCYRQVFVKRAQASVGMYMHKNEPCCSTKTKTMKDMSTAMPLRSINYEIVYSINDQAILNKPYSLLTTDALGHEANLFKLLQKMPPAHLFDACRAHLRHYLSLLVGEQTSETRTQEKPLVGRSKLLPLQGLCIYVHMHTDNALSKKQ